MKELVRDAFGREVTIALAVAVVTVEVAAASVKALARWWCRP